jgi:hypothetical protein
MTMQWYPLSDKPESGKRIVALYNDGSGATLFLVHDHGITDQDGDEYEELSPDNHEMWAYLPDDF